MTSPLSAPRNTEPTLLLSTPIQASSAVLDSDSLPADLPVITSVSQEALYGRERLGNSGFEGTLLFTGDGWLYQSAFKEHLFSDLSEWMRSFPKGIAYPITELDFNELDSFCMKEVIDLIKGCGNLRTLNLSQSQHFQLNLLLQAVATSCPFLEKLELVGCRQVEDLFLEMILKSCFQLRRLDVRYCESLKGRFLRSLTQFARNLEVFFIDRDVQQEGDKKGPFLRFQGKEFIDFFKRHPKLVEISLSGQTKEVLGLDEQDEMASVSVDVLLDACPNLQVLDLCHCDWAKGALSKIGQKCSSLRALFWDGGSVDEIRNEDLFALGKGCRSLEILCLFGERGNVTDHSIEFLTENCPHLTELFLEGIAQITNRSFQAIQKNSEKLEVLRLKQVKVGKRDYEIDEETLVTFLRGMGDSFRNLGLENFALVSPSLFLKVPERFSNWKTISIANCGSQAEKKDLSELVLQNIIKFCPEISILEFTDCPQLQFNMDFFCELLRNCGDLNQILLSPFRMNGTRIYRVEYEKPRPFRLVDLEFDGQKISLTYDTGDPTQR